MWSMTYLSERPLWFQQLLADQPLKCSTVILLVLLLLEKNTIVAHSCLLPPWPVKAIHLNTMDDMRSHKSLHSSKQHGYHHSMPSLVALCTAMTSDSSMQHGYHNSRLGLIALCTAQTSPFAKHSANLAGPPTVCSATARMTPFFPCECVLSLVCLMVSLLVAHDEDRTWAD